MLLINVRKIFGEVPNNIFEAIDKDNIKSQDLLAAILILEQIHDSGEAINFNERIEKFLIKFK